MQENLGAYWTWETFVPSLYDKFIQWNHYNYSHSFNEKSEISQVIKKFGSDRYWDGETNTGVIFPYNYYINTTGGFSVDAVPNSPRTQNNNVRKHFAKTDSYSNIIHLPLLEPSLDSYFDLKTVSDTYETVQDPDTGDDIQVLIPGKKVTLDTILDYKCFAEIRIEPSKCNLVVAITKDGFLTETITTISTKSFSKFELCKYDKETQTFNIYGITDGSWGLNAFIDTNNEHYISFKIDSNGIYSLIHHNINVSANNHTIKYMHSTKYPQKIEGSRSGYFLNFHNNASYYFSPHYSKDKNEIVVQLLKCNNTGIEEIQSNKIEFNLGYHYVDEFNSSTDFKYSGTNQKINISTFYSKLNDTQFEVQMYFIIKSSTGYKLTCRKYLIEILDTLALNDEIYYNILSFKDYHSNTIIKSLSDLPLVIPKIADEHNLNNRKYITVSNITSMYSANWSSVQYLLNGEEFTLYELQLDENSSELIVTEKFKQANPGSTGLPAPINIFFLYEGMLINYTVNLTQYHARFNYDQIAGTELYFYDSKTNEFKLEKIFDSPIYSIKTTKDNQLIICTQVGANVNYGKFDKYYLTANPKLKVEYINSSINFNESDLDINDQYSGTINQIRLTHDTALYGNTLYTFEANIEGSGNYFIHNGKISERIIIKLRGKDSIEVGLITRSENDFELKSKIFEDEADIEPITYLARTVINSKIIYPKITNLRYCAIAQHTTQNVIIGTDDAGDPIIETVPHFRRIDIDGNIVETAMHPNLFTEFEFTDSESKLQYHSNAKYICFFIGKIVIIANPSTIIKFKELFSESNMTSVKMIQVLRMLYSNAKVIDNENGSIILTDEFANYNPQDLIIPPTNGNIQYQTYLSLEKQEVSSIIHENDFVAEMLRLKMDIKGDDFDPDEELNIIEPDNAIQLLNKAYSKQNPLIDKNLTFEVRLNKYKINEGDSFEININTNHKLKRDAYIYPNISVYNKGYYDINHSEGDIEPYIDGVIYNEKYLMKAGENSLTITIKTKDDFTVSQYQRYLIVDLGIQDALIDYEYPGVGGFANSNIRSYNYTAFDFKRANDSFIDDNFENVIPTNYELKENHSSFKSKINMQDSLIVLPMFDDDTIKVSILTANTAPVKEGYNLEYQIHLSKQTDQAIYVKLKFSGAELSENIFALDTVRIPANTSFVNVKIQTIRTMKSQDYNVRIEIEKAYQGSSSKLDLNIDDLKKYIDFTILHIDPTEQVSQPTIPLPNGITVTGSSKYAIRQGVFCTTKTVSGLRYVTETLDGYGLMLPQYIRSGVPYVFTEVDSNNSGGNFYLSKPETVRFYLGDVQIGYAVKAKPIMNPLDIFPNSTVDSIEVINFCRIIEGLSTVPFTSALTDIKIKNIEGFYAEIDWTSEEDIQRIKTQLNITYLPTVEETYFRFRAMLALMFGTNYEKLSPYPKIDFKTFKIKTVKDENGNDIEEIIYVDSFNFDDEIYCRLESTIPLKAEIRVEVEMYSETLVRTVDYMLVNVDDEFEQNQNPEFVINQNLNESNIYRLKFVKNNITNIHKVRYRVSGYMNSESGELLGGLPYIQTTVEEYNNFNVNFK